MMAAIKQQNQGQDLQMLFAGFVDQAWVPDLSVTGLALDSREIKPGYLFLACRGTAQHGIHFIDMAIANGAVAVAFEPDSLVETPSGCSVPLFEVESLHWVAGEVASRFYGEPSHAMKVVGITGTNGKTSVSQFIAQAISDDTPCGVIGTLGSGLFGRLDSTGHTTPDAISVQRQLATMLDAGARHVAMEVSSHALDQGRVNGVLFDVAVYTNLSHEHLDYHGDMLSYAGAKRRLLEMPGLQQAVINADDAVGREWLDSMPSGVAATSYALEGGEGESRSPSLFADELKLDTSGLSLKLHHDGHCCRMQTRLLGRFNVSNLLAAHGALMALGYGFDEAASKLEQVHTVAGRMEPFGGGKQPLMVVDYAHTPDALAHVLNALREHCEHRLWCIFGCGGERDREKRPMMGKIAEQLADSVLLTDDNPRRENPYTIIEEIIAGTANPDAIYVNRDRASAIAHALELSSPGDVILVAGKGHEREQQIGDRLIPYSDRDVVAKLLGEEVRNG